MQIPVFSTLSLSVENAVAQVSLNRPEKANSMNAAMWQELEQCFQWLDIEPAVRVVILSGEGRHFCSGIDLAMFADIAQQGNAIADPARQSELLRQKILSLQANLTAVEQCRKPVLAAIHHSCIGGGVDLVSCCDMRYCSEDAYFSIKEIDLAMTADVGTLQRLPHLISQGMVRELAYTGRRLEAAEALSLGLVNAVYADRELLLKGVMAIALQIAEKSPLAIRGSKEMLLYARDHSVSDGLNYIATWNAAMLSVHDITATVAAAAKGEAAKYDD